MAKTEKKTKKEDNLKPFKKGQSGNPNGRPKGQRNYATIYREALIKLADLNDKTPEALEEEMLSKAILSARKGDYRFYKDLLDRLYGKAVQSIDHTTAGKELGTIDIPKEDRELIKQLHEGLKNNMKRRSREMAEKEGELVVKEKQDE